jgi:integrase
MKYKELQDETNIKVWLRTRRAKPNTVHAYLVSMQQYTDFHGLSPTELIGEAEEEQSTTYLPLYRRAINNRLLDFRDNLERAGVSHSTVLSRLKAIRSFYKFFGIQLPDTPRSDREIKPVNNLELIPDKEMIREVLKIADPMETAIILVGASSGLSAADICDLKIQDFKRGYDTATGITTLRLYRVKTRFKFITFLTPEASKAVLDYLEYRGREVGNNAARTTQVAKQRVINDSGYLFIQRNVKKAFTKSQDERLRKLRETNIIELYERLTIDSRLSEKQGNYNIFRSHNLRKFFNNVLIKQGVDLETKEYLMGHKVNSSMSHYNIHDVDVLRDKYLSVVPYLTIEKDVDVSESQEYLKIKMENEQLIIEAERVHVERNELNQLKNEIRALRDAAIQKEQQESAFNRIILGLIGKLDRDESWDSLYAEHLRRAKVDDDYAVMFKQYQIAFGFTQYGEGGSQRDTREGTNQKPNLVKTLDRLLK